MPKQSFKIQGFHGGLSSDSDPRDLRPAESPSLQDAGIDSVGRLKVLGKVDNGNVYHSGTALGQTGTPATTSVRLAATANTVDDYYNSAVIAITDGTNSGEERIISDYDAAGHANGAKTAIVSVAFTAACDATSVYEIRGDANVITILKNKGLFVMSSDRQLDKGVADETLIFCLDNDNDNIDVRDSEGWDNGLIAMGGASSPVYYSADGVVRVSDATFARDSQWFGYIADQRFAGLNAIGPAANWFNVDQALPAPTSGKSIMSTPIIGGDTNGIFSAAAEYIGDVINNGTDALDVVEHSAVNLRVGVQLNEIIVSGHADWDYNRNNRADPSADTADIYPIIGTAVTKLEGSGTTSTQSTIGVDGLSFTVGENEVMIFSVFMITAEYNNVTSFGISADHSSSGEQVFWRFGSEQLSPNKWNLLVCGSDNISSGSEYFPISSSTSDFSLVIEDTASSGGSADKIDFYVSGVAIAEANTITGFSPGVYTFYYSWLYDAENKQESLPFTFNDLDLSSSEPDDINAINIVGIPALFNFDTYICSNVSAGSSYALNQRISGARLYWKVEENDNYFLIGELDFIDKGFKWLPDADIISYDTDDTTNTTGNILSRTAIIKGISPESANIVDTFKTINGFSSEVDSLDAQYKTAVVHGRRVYIGNIEQDGTTHPDRILKSQVNRFDTFPKGMGAVDVAIRDGESIVKLEAFADRILQFKQNSLYIINVSENVDFLEDTYRNKGCAFDYHVTRTDVGISWFNIHGVYLYDGRELSDLLIKEGIRLISESDWEAFVTDATDDPDMSSAMIGYIPKKKQILIKNENNDVYIYDFVLRAWTTGSGRITESTAMTNFALDADQNLFYIDNVNTTRKTWQSSPQDSTNFIYISPDIDLGEPGIRKKIYRVRLSYKGDADTLTIKYSVNGDTDTLKKFQGTNSSDGKASGVEDTTPLHAKSDLTVWHHAELKPLVSTEANSIYSFQLHMTGTVGSGFELNDITIIYRMKSIK